MDMQNIYVSPGLVSIIFTRIITWVNNKHILGPHVYMYACMYVNVCLFRYDVE